MEISDEQIVERAAKNDLGAFEQLVDKYRKRIYYIAYRMTNSHSDADDIAQETFIRAFRNLGAFQGQSRFYTWLYRILINCCTDHLRKRKRRGEYELNETLDIESHAHLLADIRTTPGADEEAQLNELRYAVSEALESLSPPHRAVLVLHEYNGVPHRDIARILGCSEGTVRSRLHYARRKMQHKLRRFLK